MNILFWNINGNPIVALIARCALEHDVDIICLAEHRGIEPEQLYSELGEHYRWVNRASGCDKIRMFAKDSVTHIDVSESSRFIVCSFVHGCVSYVMAVTHLPDRRNYPTSEERCRILRRVVAELKAYEEKANCDSAIVLGDFNANPFDPELTQRDTLNATIFKGVIKRQATRTSFGEEFPLMYNPVLRFLSEEPMSYGSYYMVGGNPPIYWHCLDQVVVSRSLVDRVTNMVYLREIEGASLMNEVTPNRAISDHLPLLVTIEGESDE